MFLYIFKTVKSYYISLVDNGFHRKYKQTEKAKGAAPSLALSLRTLHSTTTLLCPHEHKRSLAKLKYETLEPRCQKPRQDHLCLSLSDYKDPGLWPSASGRHCNPHRGLSPPR